MNSSFGQRQQLVHEKLAAARDKIATSEARLRDIDSEIEGLAEQRQRYELLGQAYDALDKLERIGAANLFWGDDTGSFIPAQRMETVRSDVNGYREQMARFEEARQTLRGEIHEQELKIEDLNYHLEELKELERREKEEFVVQREIRERPYRPSVMPWHKQGEDERRYRKILLLMLLFMLLIGGIPMIWKLPPPDTSQAVVVPERLARMIKKKTPPKPPEPIKEAKKEEKPEEKTQKKEETKPKEKPTPVEVQQARTKAETKGVLAFKNSFSDLMEDASTSELGADARVTNAGSQAAGGAAGQRSLIVAQAGSGSGGIANSSVSRGGVGGGSGGAITGGGVAVSRASSAISDMKGEDRPLSKGVGPARTDEEIQIVFDKYKSALYRIYNRELRNDPTLRGKMVLAITIEPDGHVSACKVQSTDMNSQQLSADIVERVMKFNFGAKEGVPTTKILYPIDFLPSS